MNKKRIVPLIIPFILLVLSELFLIYPSFFFVSISLGLIFILFGIRYLAKDNDEKFWPSYLVLPSFIWIGFSSYAYLLPNQFLIQLFHLSMVILNFIYFKYIYYYLFSKKNEKEKSLDNFSYNYSFLIVFTLFSSFYTLPLFININFTLFFFALGLVLLLLFWQTILFLKGDRQVKVILAFISAILLGQLSWVLFMLPLKANILGFIMALIFYFVSTMLRLNIKGELNKTTIKWPLVLTIIMIVLVLFSAPWI
ncbi:MAG: hypothetical protein PF488_00880 [Patescibacteria group bacterium]|jgi:hypothetical protein|nr:hypothetical protein [Patescibacteria group bacterium]